MDNNYYVVAKKNDEILVNSSVTTFTQNNIKDATTFILHIGDNEITYGAQINSAGGLSSIDGNSKLSRANTMTIVGGQENYNYMLSIQGINAPKEIVATTGANIVVNGEEVKPVFVVYDDGEVYIKGSTTLLTEEQLKSYWSDTYNEIRDVFDNKSKSDDNNPNNTVPSSSGNHHSAPSGRRKSSGKNNSNKADESKKGNKESKKSTENGDLIIKVDYDSLSPIAESLTKLKTKLSSTVDSYETYIKQANDDSSWSGGYKDQFVSIANGEYKKYFEDIADKIEKLSSQLTTSISDFEEAEKKIKNFTL